LWNGFQAQFEGILAKLEIAQWIFEECDTGATYQTYIRKRLGSDKAHHKLIAEEHGRRMNMVMTWLAANERPQYDHEVHRSLRNEYPGTASWILDHHIMKEWMTFDDIVHARLVWMTGVPGAGKKTTQTFMEHLFKCD
jgi:hypothetical protein